LGWGKGVKKNPDGRPPPPPPPQKKQNGNVYTYKNDPWEEGF